MQDLQMVTMALNERRSSLLSESLLSVTDKVMFVQMFPDVVTDDTLHNPHNVWQKIYGPVFEGVLLVYPSWAQLLQELFSTVGTVLLVREISKRLERTGEISGGQSSRTLAEMPSAPLAFDVSSLQSFLITILGQICIEDNINLLGSWLYCRWNLAVSIEM